MERKSSRFRATLNEWCYHAHNAYLSKLDEVYLRWRLVNYIEVDTDIAMFEWHRNRPDV